MTTTTTGPAPAAAMTTTIGPVAAVATTTESAA